MRELQKYLQEVRRLKITDAQPEVLTFMGAILSDGIISYQSPSVRVAPGYAFFCEQIKGGCPIPPSVYPLDPVDSNNISQPSTTNTDPHIAVIGEFLPYISFNVKNEGMSKSMFKTPLTMNMFVNAMGTTEGLKFETPISFFEGADISVEWFVDLVSMFKTYGNAKVRNNFNPACNVIEYSDTLEALRPRVEFYVHLIGSLIRAQTVL